MKLKRVKRIVTSALVGIVAVLGISCSVKTDKVKKEYQYYSSNQQIDYIIDQLDCDTEYLTKKGGKYIRMSHNDGDPIYVTFDNLDKSIERNATEALDFTFDVLSSINDNYY